VHLATDNADQALPVFQKLARMNREDISPLALFWLGTTQLVMNRRDEAVDSFRLLWERYAESQLVRRAVYSIARTYAEQGAFLDAIRLYEAVSAIDSMPREKVMPGDILTIKVWDPDHYIGTGQYTIPVKIVPTSGDVEELRLEMNKINRALFLGTIRTELGKPNANDGILQVCGTDLIYVTYEDRFGKFDPATGISPENIGGRRQTSVIQVADDAEITISPMVFVERGKAEEEDLYKEKTEEELAEERRLQTLSARLERGEEVVRPGNPVYIRVKDANCSRTGEADSITVTVFTYSSTTAQEQSAQQIDLVRAMAQPLPLEAVATIPSNRESSTLRAPAPNPQGRPRLDTVRVTLTETGPYTGIFYGTVKTAVNDVTAIASDFSGEHVPAMAIDGRNRAEHAWMAFIDGKPDKWLEIDMKELYDVSKVVWDRGEGADDRFMINYTVTFRGHGTPIDLKQEGNKSAHKNEIVLERPITCRWIRFTAHKYDSDAPAIAHVEVYDKDGKLIVPPKVSPLQRGTNDVLEFNVGDCMAAEVLDEVNINPGRPVTRTSNPLGVAYVDGTIDAVYISRGENDVRGSPILVLGKGREEKHVFARRTKRVRTKDVLQIAVFDPDLDVDEQLNSVDCEVISSSGDSAKLTARELDKTAAIFTTRIQLSESPEAQKDDLRLWVRPGDYIMMRYRDEENRNPGHAVWRESFVFVADDELADFPPEIGKVKSPQTEEHSLEPPNWLFSILEPDQALPGIDRVEIQALSFATGDRVRFNALLRDLDGTFESRVPVTIGDKPQVELPKDADPTKPRRLRPLDERHISYGETGWQRGAASVFDVPFAVVGDDIVYTSYEDETARVAAGRLFMGVVSPSLIENLRKLGVKTDELPEAAKTEGVLIVLKDPCTALAERNQTRANAILDEIARKKRHYRAMEAEYKLALERIGKRIDELAKKEGRAPPAPAREAPAPKTIDRKDAPLTTEEELGADELGEGAMATEDVILAAALRRDRDGLAEALVELQRRLAALEKAYNTSEREAAIAKMEEEYRKAAAQPKPPEPPTMKKEMPPAWYTQPNWWKQCGGIVPGTVLKIRVEDADIQGDGAVVTVAPLGGQMPRFYEYTARPVEGAQGVFEVAVPTSAEDGVEGALALNGVAHLMFTYRDTAQQKFVSKRSSFMSLASNAELRVTGPDFIEAKNEFHLGEDIYVYVGDADMDKTRVRDYVWVDLTSSKGDSERVFLRETQPHSGVFRGSVPTQLGEAKPNDGTLQAEFGGKFSVAYVDSLWRSEDVLPPELKAEGSFVKGSDGTVEIFARQLKRGSLQRDVLFNTALAAYELGKSATEMGAIQRGRQHLLESRDMFENLIESYPDDEVCAHATYYLGNIYFLLGDYPSAVTSLQRVIDRWPKSEFKAMALYKLGTCHLKADRFDKAVEAFVNLAYHHPESPLVADSMLTLAQHFQKQKLYKSAIGVGEAFIRKFPGHEKTGNMYLRLAGWLIMEKDLKRAITVLEEAEKALPESDLMPAFLYWHADCIFKTSSARSVEYKKGIILLQRITYDYPDSKWAKYAAARLVEVDVDR
jgi:TolA-binding protein